MTCCLIVCFKQVTHLQIIALSLGILGVQLVEHVSAGQTTSADSVQTSSNDLAPQPGVVRRDPSDIIRVDGKYYVYYSKMIHSAEVERASRLGVPLTYPAGYHSDVFGAMSDDEGHTWKEIGPIVIRGEQGSWDSNSVFTPNITCYKKKFYLYFTAVGTGFTNKSYTDFNRTSIGLAVADNPAGPFKKFNKPILESTRNPARFDSFRIDDSAIRTVDGKIWLYYKGRQWNKTPRDTKMGLAIAEHPTGPYVRANDGEPIQKSGHEVMVWEHGESVYSLVAHGHGPDSGTVRRVASADGRAFDAAEATVGPAPKLSAPGLCRPELTGYPLPSDPVRWGIQMRRHNRTHISLERFTMDMKLWLPR